MMIGGEFETHPAADVFPMLEEGELRALADDITKNGQRHPCVRIWHDTGEHTRAFRILDGRNRAAACSMIGRKPEWIEYEGDDPIGYVISLNLTRRHLDESQRALAAARIATLPRGANQHAGEAASREAPSQAGAAALLSVDRSSVQRARKVLAKAEPELVKAVERGQVTVSLAAQMADRPPEQQRELAERMETARRDKKKLSPKAVARQLEREGATRVIESEPAPLPEGPFRVITADFPWAYDVRTDDATHRGVTTYPTMTTAEGVAMGSEVLKRAHDDCVLFFWITNAHMCTGEHVPIIKAWGFDVGKTVLTWVKDRMGAGNYLRNITEHCIVAVRGNPTINLTNETTELRAPRREHSRKPDEFYALVEKLCPGSKLDIFGRQQREGWAVWGAETSKFTEV
jgi:N6-adenosine-specific RNA methylase IME4